MPTGTPNYNWQKPDVGDTNNAWGGVLNTLFDAVDAALKAVSNVANAALPKAGGAMTGRLDVLNETFAKHDFGNVSGAVSLDLSLYQVITATITGATTFTFTNVPPNASGVLVILTNGGSAAVAFTGAKWASGSMPALTAAGTDVLAFVTADGGTTMRGSLTSKDSR